MDSRIAMVKELNGTAYEDALKGVRKALEAEGFGIITEIDVKETLKKKLDVDFRRYIILGACMPAVAHRAISADPLVGVLLPCNVVVMEKEGGGSMVAAFKPSAAFSLLENPASLAPFAVDVEERISKALDRLRE